MNESNRSQPVVPPGSTLLADLSQPVVLEREGQPIAVLLSFEAYQQYQAFLQQRGQISAQEASRAADRAVFGDLVGCALSSGEPVWAPSPQPHWRIPYRTFDGVVLTIVSVDAYTAAVWLTETERAHLLEQVEQLALAPHAPA
jgi:hypothetical protein